MARYGRGEQARVVEVDSPLGPVSLVEPPRFPDPSESVVAGSLLAPMPGAVIRVEVTVGDEVSAGQPLLVMEAMKMEHTILAGADGIVAELPVKIGDQVGAGDVLVVITGSDTTE